MSLFDFIKENVLLSDYVQSLPQTSGFHSAGRNTYRCNNVLTGGGNNTSMLVNDDDGYFKMYSGDKEAGDVIKLYSLVNSIDNQKEAALGLASDMGLRVPDELLMTGSQQDSKSAMRATMASICERAHKELLEGDSEESEMALDYILDRGGTMDMVERWKLGFLPSDNDEARGFLKQSSPSLNILQKVGMTGGKSGDFPIMAGRLLFPIFSLRGEALSFSSRKIPGIDSNLEGKYINTSNTPIYEKHETLLGQHLLTKGLDNIIICEGNFDVIALNEMTDDNTVAVATCGTALTISHVNLLKRYKPRSVTIVFDGDSSGRKSAASLTWIGNHLKNVGIITLDEGEDPWDVFADGGTINLTSSEPAIVTAVKIASEDLDNNEFGEWFVKTHHDLAFSDDRNTLLRESARMTGLRKTFLQSLLNNDGNKKRSPKTAYREEGSEIELSPRVTTQISSLLSMDSQLRKSVAFPLYRNSMIDDALSLNGVLTDDDEDALLIAMGIDLQDADERLSSHVWSLTPSDEDAEQKIVDSTRIIARLLSQFIIEENIEGLPPAYLSSLSLIASGMSGATPLDRLTFLYDVMATVVDQ